MTSLSIGEQDENFFRHHEQPSIKDFNGIKSIQHILSSSSSMTSTTQPPNQPYRSYSTQNLTAQNQHEDVNLFVNQFERRLDEHRLFWQKEYDRKIQQMIETKNHDINGLKQRYETKLNDLENSYRQLEIHSGQINEENKRLKIELEHEKQHHKIEQVNIE